MNVPTIRALILGTFCGLIFVVSPVSRPSVLWRDFNAFYCGGRTVVQAQNPYLAEPLGACERMPHGPLLQTSPPRLTLPAPLPPYDFAIFAPLARLPYELAGVLWLVAMAGCSIATARGLHRLSGLSTAACLALIFPTMIYSSGSLGEIAPLAIMAITLGTEATANKRPRVAALWACVAMVQPHVGLAAVLSLALNLPKARVSLIIGALLLYVVAVQQVGLATCIQYFEQILPAHAIAETASTNQISLTALLNTIDVAPSLALIAGSLSLFVMIVAGLTLAMRIARRRRYDPLVFALPVAFGIVGGIFMHVTQLPAALPALIVLWSRSASGFWKNSFAAIIILIAIPWVQFEFLGLGFAAIVAASLAALGPELCDISALRALIVAVAFGSIVIALDCVLIGRGITMSQLVLPPIGPNDLPETNWALNMNAISRVNPDLYTVARSLSWLGTFAMVFITTLSVTRLQRRSATSRAEAPDWDELPTGAAAN